MEFCFSYCFYVFSTHTAQANAPLIYRGCHMGKGHLQKGHSVSPCPVVLLRLYHKVSEVVSIQHQRYRYLEATRCWPKFLLVSTCLRMCIPRLKAAIKKCRPFPCKMKQLTQQRQVFYPRIPLVDVFLPLVNFCLNEVCEIWMPESKKKIPRILFPDLST